jgi:hypothetical protein
LAEGLNDNIEKLQEPDELGVVQEKSDEKLNVPLTGAPGGAVGVSVTAPAVRLVGSISSLN